MSHVYEYSSVGIKNFFVENFTEPTKKGKIFAGVLSAFAFSQIGSSPLITTVAFATIFCGLAYITNTAKFFLSQIIQIQSGHTFPSWYKTKTVFDACILTNIDLHSCGQTVTTAEVAKKNFTKLVNRQSTSVHAMKTLFSGNNPDTSTLKTKIFNAFSSRGIEINCGEDDPQSLVWGIDSRYVTNHQNALTFIEENLLASPSKIQTPKQLESFICDLHDILTKGLVTSSKTPIQGGMYRSKAVLVFPENTGGELSSLIPLVKKKDPSAVEEFTSLYLKLQAATDTVKQLEQFSKREKEILSLVIGISCSTPEQIADDMKTFTTDYFKKLKSGVHAIDLASWLFMRLMIIHPFDDGNGRLGRMLANAELTRGELSPYFIFDEEE